MKKFGLYLIMMLLFLFNLWSSDQKETRDSYYKAIDEKIRQINIKLEKAPTDKERGILLKKKAEMIFDKSVFSRDYIDEAIYVMGKARRMFEQSHCDVLLSETLTALGNLHRHLNQNIKAYELYVAAADAAKGKDMYAYFSAEVNRSGLCCQMITDQDPQFLIKAMTDKQINGNACCVEIPKKLIETAKQTGDIELEFLANRAYYGTVSYLAAKQGEAINDDLKDKVAHLAFRLLTEKDQSTRHAMAAETLIMRSLEILNSRSGDYKIIIGWLKGSIRRIASLEYPNLTYSALKLFGIALNRIKEEPGSAIKSLETALLMGLELGKDVENLHPLIASLIGVYIDTGDFDKPVRLLSGLLKLKSFTKEWWLYKFLGDTYDVKGNYIEALRSYEKALKLVDAGKSHYARANVRYDMSYSYQNVGEFDKARQLLIESLILYEQDVEELIGFREKYPMLPVEKNIGYYTEKDRDFFEARAKIQTSELSGQLTILLNNVWNCYLELARISLREGNLKEAREHYLKSAKWYQRGSSVHYYGYPKIFGDPGTTIGLCRLALTAGNLDEAMQYLKYYREEQQKNDVMFNRPLQKNEVLLLQAELAYKRGNLNDAENILNDAFNLAAAHGFEVEKATILKQRALVFAAQRRMQKAYDTFIKALELESELWKYVMFSASQHAKLDFLETQAEGFNAFLSFINQFFPKDSPKIKKAFTLLQMRKGIVFESQTKILKTVNQSLDKETQKKLERLSHVKAEMARLILGKSNFSWQEVQKRIGQYRGEVSRIERDLVREKGLLAMQLHGEIPTPSLISAKFPANSALVEFTHIKDYDFKNRNWTGQKRYLVFVLEKSTALHYVDLADARPIDDLSRQLSTSIRRDIGQLQRVRIIRLDKSKLAIGKLLTSLYSTIWAPIEEKTGQKNTFIVSPDGLLNIIPFAALKDNKGKYLIEKCSLAYVCVGRDLLRNQKYNAENSSLDLLLAANPDFGPSLQKQNNTGVRSHLLYGLRSHLKPGFFNPLPGTEKEAKRISRLFDKDKVKVLVGIEAEEKTVKRVKNVRILHLATHGFFLEPGKNQNYFQEKGFENPLLRSGIALAGANKAYRIENEEDGILTAYEVTGMDLSNTELVVLSACETGVGSVRSGEGVFGLRRAFALAGAKNMLLTLWPVSDDITADLMIRFYQVYKNGKFPLTALREAQLETIKNLRIKRKSALPALWAPFILQVSGAEYE